MFILKSTINNYIININLICIGLADANDSNFNVQNLSYNAFFSNKIKYKTIEKNI